jgi:CHASE3 domain sensor protein
MQNNLTIILGVLFVLALGAGIYFYMGAQTIKIQLISTEATIQSLQTQVQVLTAERDVLQNKLSQGKTYVDYINTLIWPVMKESNITTNIEFSDMNEWFSDMERRTQELNDQELINAWEKIKASDQNGFNMAIIRVLSQLEEILK